MTSFVIGKNSGRGKSSKCRSPKTCKKCLVVPYSNGRPNSSDRPTIRTRSRSISCRSTSPHCTPRIASISARKTGWRYATTAKVSMAGAESRTSKGMECSRRSQERTSDASIVEIRPQLPPLETHFPRHHNADSRLGPVYALSCHPPSRPIGPIFGFPAAHGSKTKSLPVARYERAENCLPPRLVGVLPEPCPSLDKHPSGLLSSQQSGCRYREATLFKHRPRVTGNVDIPSRLCLDKDPCKGSEEKNRCQVSGVSKTWARLPKKVASTAAANCIF